MKLINLIKNNPLIKPFLLLSLFISSSPILAASVEGGTTLSLTNHWIGFFCIGVFVLAYGLVMHEELISLSKSKPVLISAAVIWSAIAWIYSIHGLSEVATAALKHTIMEFAELMLFLLVAMTYINTMIERNVFEYLRAYLVSRGMGFRQLFVTTGVIAFILSPIADNLTTALVLCAVLLSVASGNRQFIVLGCINVVVAANAGGAFSPFGDITTLMVWQKGIVNFTEFFSLFIPSLVNFLIPMVIMYFFVPNEHPKSTENKVQVLPGGWTVVILFFLTISTAVTMHSLFHLPPMFGMMTGLGYLMVFSYVMKILHKTKEDTSQNSVVISHIEFKRNHYHFNSFHRVAAAEWDTLLFFYGVILSVGGLGFLGYLSLLAEVMYVDLGPTTTNILLGIVSAIVDNIPVMFAVLSMNPEMSLNQWLLITLTAGVGGSLLSIGSAAGVAVMGQAKGHYTFGKHLKWTPVIALGYFASVYVHILINGV